MAKLVVPGGNGFIGREICRVAVMNGHDVAAFARSGRPDPAPATRPWASQVEWRAAGVFVPQAWRDLLDRADAVVHCIATIRQDVEQNVTFDRVNAESAIVVAEEATAADVDTFVFLSVRNKPPFVSGRFLAAKRRAEHEIPNRHPDLRFVSLRPNLVYGADRLGTGTVAAALDHVPSLQSHGYLAEMGRSLPVEIVAAAAIQAATTPTLHGTLSVEQIDDLARTSGLIDPDEIADASLFPLMTGVGGAAVFAWLLRRWCSK